MHASDRIVIAVLDQLVAHAHALAAELTDYAATPARARLAAEEVAANFVQRRRDMLDDIMLCPIGEC